MIEKLNDLELKNVSGGRRTVIIREEYEIPSYIPVNFTPVGGMILGGILIAAGSILFGTSAIVHHLSNKN